MILRNESYHSKVTEGESDAKRKIIFPMDDDDDDEDDGDRDGDDGDGDDDDDGER